MVLLRLKPIIEPKMSKCWKESLEGVKNRLREATVPIVDKVQKVIKDMALFVAYLYPDLTDLRKFTILTVFYFCRL